jgi:hypothetical protein
MPTIREGARTARSSGEAVMMAVANFLNKVAEGLRALASLLVAIPLLIICVLLLFYALKGMWGAMTG